MVLKKKIKVLWLASWYPSRENNYFGIFIKKQAIAASAGCELSVLYAQESLGNTYEIDIETSFFLQVIVYYPKSNFLFFKWMRYFKALLKGFNEIKNRAGKPELVHVHVTYPVGMTAMYLKFFHNLNFIISEHSSFYKKWSAGKMNNHFIVKIISKICFNQAAVTIALSENHANILRKLNLAHCFRVIPNVVDTDIFNLPIENRPLKKDKLRLLHVSSLYESDKNVMGILRGVALLNRHRQDFELHIIGNEIYHADLKKYAVSLGLLENCITFQAFMPQTEVAQAMQSADIFILFSRIEGLPCVILEAMSVGLPIIATETGGMSEWITPETGVLLTIEDEAGLCEAVNSVMDNYHQYDPSVIRSKIVEKCSVEVVGQGIVYAYEEVLKQERSTLKFMKIEH